MASHAKGIIDSVSNDFEMICCYANVIIGYYIKSFMDVFLLHHLSFF